LFLLSDEHNNINFVHLVYLTLLHVSALQISHHQVGHGYTKRLTGRDLSLQTVGLNPLFILLLCVQVLPDDG